MTLEELNQALSLMSVPAGVPRTIETLTNFPGFKGALASRAARRQEVYHGLRHRPNCG